MKENKEKSTATPPKSTEKKPKSEDVSANKTITFLSYIGFLCLVPLLARGESEFAKFHAKQGVVLLILWIIGGILTFIGIGVVIQIATVVLSIIGLINVNDGKMKDLPVIGEWAKKLDI